MKRKIIGYVVSEEDPDGNWEQLLCLRKADDYPQMGALDWRNKGEPAHLFGTHKEARAAIVRSEHFRLAFGLVRPEAKNRKIYALETEAT